MPESKSLTPSFDGFDSSDEDRGKNGLPAIAAQVRLASQALNAIQHQNRIVAAGWAGGAEAAIGTGYGVNTGAVGVRTLWNHHHTPGRRLRGRAGVLKSINGRVAGQGLAAVLDGGATVTYPMDYDLSGGPAARTEATDYESADFLTDTDHAAAASRVTATFGSNTSNGPDIRSFLLWEAARTLADPSITPGYTSHEKVEPAKPIVTLGPTGSLEVLSQLRLNFLHTWNRMRPQVAWSCGAPGTNYIEFATASTSWRYIFDQSIGDGGTAPAYDGPAFTFPLRFSARGLKTTVTMAVYVYAAMSGATDTGSIGISHKATDTTMTTIAALTSPATISGATYAWYPALGATPATFEARADVDVERIVLCAKSSGATDKVRIGAFVLFPLPSSTIA